MNAPVPPARKNQFQARLDHMKQQLERHGYSAEVVVRTTPEATDIINFARLWEFIIVTADRSTRGYMSQSTRADFDKTRQEFIECVDFMIEKLRGASKRHKIDLGGNNFMSRIAQRYKIVDRKRSSGKPEKAEGFDTGHTDDLADDFDMDVAPAPKAEKPAKPAAVKKPAVTDVDGL
jgi:hypothetical protein